MTPWPEDFAAEWRVTERMRLGLRGLTVLYVEVSLAFGEVLDAILEIERVFAGYRNAVHAKRLSVWRPWR